MLQEYDPENLSSSQNPMGNNMHNADGLKTENVIILSSMKGVSPVKFDNSQELLTDSGANSSLKKYEKPGYIIAHFVEKFMDTDAGHVPVVRARLNLRDRLSTIAARSGITRNNYKVAPGLYAIGEPDGNSEILVTANFKLTFDTLRTNIPKVSAWILVLDTVGVNVWCAAGKGTFSTNELVRQIQSSGIEKLVTHRRIILPQLGATGIRAKDVKKMCGFSVIYGPVRASDICLFLKNNKKADPDMRRVTFTFAERLVLTPVELNISLKYVLITAIILLVISGIGPGVFSFENAGKRGWTSIVFLLTGVLSGAVATPLLLPFLPFKEFAAKGITSGALFAVCAFFILSPASLSISAIMALLLFGTAVSSWLSMNFTGATPFTSPSGVEKEMKKFIPVQAGAVILSLFLWVYSAF